MTLFQPGHRRADLRLHLTMGAGQTILLGGEHRDPLPTALEECRQRLGLLVFPRPRLGLDAVTQARPHHGIQGIGLGQDPQGFSKVARLARIDHGRGELRLDQPSRDLGLQTPVASNDL